jgi:hypothetical protein
MSHEASGEWSSWLLYQKAPLPKNHFRARSTPLMTSPGNQAICGVEILPTVAYSKCDGTRLVSINVPLESSLPFIY